MTRSRLPSAGMNPGRWMALGLLIPLCSPVTAGAQVRDRDARIPRSGEVWIEVAPQFASWNRQYAEGSAEASDGQREPLFADYDGNVADRLFPGLDPLLDIVNRDADDLGFEPLTAGDLDMGATEFGSLDVFVRSIPLSLQVGLGGFAALEVLVPLVKTEVETGFTFDSATAALVRAETALSDPSGFFSGLDAAQSQLRALIDGGTLTPQDSMAAETLLSDTEAFQGALDARISGQSYLFTAGSTSGQQISAYYAGFTTGFQAYGITAPSLDLAGSATRSDLNAYFEREPVLGQPPGKVVRGYSIGEIDVGVRLKIFDNFGWPSRPPEPEAPPDAADAAPPAPAVDRVPETVPSEGAIPEAEAGEEPSPEAAPPGDEVPEAVPTEERFLETVPAGVEQAAEVEEKPASPQETGPGFRYRTTIGARYRFALSDPDRDPYLVPDVFLQQPIGDGQPDVQLELFQDLAVGSRFWLVAGATAGIQLGDELVRRVAAPDAPYALASQEVTVARDLGDYFSFVVSPRFALLEALSLAVEYTFWSKGDDSYEAVDGNVDPTPLTLETGETRHTLGIGAYYRTSRMFAAGRSGFPIDLAFMWETAIGGSGGRTAAASVATVSLRVPFMLF